MTRGVRGAHCPIGAVFGVVVPKGALAEIGRHCDGYISICDCRFGRALQEWQSISRLVELQFNDNGRR